MNILAKRETRQKNMKMMNLKKWASPIRNRNLTKIFMKRQTSRIPELYRGNRQAPRASVPSRAGYSKSTTRLGCLPLLLPTQPETKQTQVLMSTKSSKAFCNNIKNHKSAHRLLEVVHNYNHKMLLLSLLPDLVLEWVDSGKLPTLIAIKSL